MATFTTDGLFLDLTQTLVVKVHPTVLFSILDHYNRRPEKQARVIGTLLGSVVSNVVEVSNAFGVPHAEAGEDVALGQDYHRTMYQMCQRVNDKERIVGWYATTLDGVELPSSSIIIHHFYTGTAGTDTSTESRKLFHLTVDTSMSSGTVSVKAFVTSVVTVGGQPVANSWNQVKVQIVTSEPERVSIDRMIKGQDIERAWSSSETLATVQSPEDDLEASVTALLGMLESVSAFVDRVVDGQEDPDGVLGVKIADTLSSLPRVRPELFDSVFSGNLQDLLMVSYLASLTKANLALSEKLSGVKAS